GPRGVHQSRAPSRHLPAPARLLREPRGAPPPAPATPLRPLEPGAHRKDRPWPLPSEYPLHAGARRGRPGRSWRLLMKLLGFLAGTLNKRAGPRRDSVVLSAGATGITD